MQSPNVQEHKTARKVALTMVAAVVVATVVVLTATWKAPQAKAGGLSVRVEKTDPNMLMMMMSSDDSEVLPVAPRPKHVGSDGLLVKKDSVSLRSFGRALINHNVNVDGSNHWRTILSRHFNAVPVNQELYVEYQLNGVCGYHIHEHARHLVTRILISYGGRTYRAVGLNDISGNTVFWGNGNGNYQFIPAHHAFTVSLQYRSMCRGGVFVGAGSDWGSIEFEVRGFGY